MCTAPGEPARKVTAKLAGERAIEQPVASNPTIQQEDAVLAAVDEEARSVDPDELGRQVTRDPRLDGVSFTGGGNRDS